MRAITLFLSISIYILSSFLWLPTSHLSSPCLDTPQLNGVKYLRYERFNENIRVNIDGSRNLTSQQTSPSSTCKYNSFIAVFSMPFSHWKTELTSQYNLTCHDIAFYHTDILLEYVTTCQNRVFPLTENGNDTLEARRGVFLRCVSLRLAHGLSFQTIKKRNNNRKCSCCPMQTAATTKMPPPRPDNNSWRRDTRSLFMTASLTEMLTVS